ncbi:HPr family phosphocarrier protein [Bifidobacterium sp. SMB2]|uniref:Phosphocarrier protein HPr n=1 Tax=Bifidobacterium saimiriisciurei TaxID=2661627 RepID=A0ABX0C7Z0_9BIFI|nr:MULTISPECIES: HPr family phosphocarrier protein [Bifidobacterium]NEG95196.1 HPr family phosphocarrier protein [Bifidobacterium sp. SMB2]NEH11273.1 HPr family phosphocarrier protein [Bifidobacterium saimiriisciurei]
MITRTVTIGTPLGLHARPAARFVQAVIDSGLHVTMAHDGREVDAGSILSVMSLNVVGGDVVMLTTNADETSGDGAGVDAVNMTMDSLTAMLASNLDE